MSKKKKRKKSIKITYEIEEKKITYELEEKAIKLALELVRNRYPDNSEKRTFSIDDIDEGDILEFEYLLTACRRSVIDGFPLEDYEIEEIPLMTEEYWLIYFDNKHEFGRGETYNPHAHEIIFLCPTSKMIAVPHRHAHNNKCIYPKACKNCFDAVFECGMYMPD